MRSFKKLMAVPVLAIAFVLSSSIANQHQALAEVYSCQAGTNCPNASSCTGSHWLSDGCSITCYSEGTRPGQIVFSGSANCGTSGGGGGGETE